MADYDRLSDELQRLPSDIRWGLQVYRATYEDQELWERYIEYVRNAIMSSLQPFHDHISEEKALRLKMLRDSFRLVTREDDSWDNLTLFQMRDLLDGHGIPSGDRPEPDARWIADGMNSDYFIYVNKEILMDFKAIEDSRQGPAPNYIEEDVAVIIVQHLLGWWDCDEEDAGKDWQYVCAFWFGQFYNYTFHDSEAWYALFVSPPGKWDVYSSLLHTTEHTSILEQLSERLRF